MSPLLRKTTILMLKTYLKKVNKPTENIPSGPIASQNIRLDVPIAPRQAPTQIHFHFKALLLTKHPLGLPSDI